MADTDAPERMESGLEIDGIDVQAGIALSGSPELYQKILRVYYRSIPKKSDLIRGYLAQRNLAAYTIEVHALKSASKAVGAEELSRLAAELERRGLERDLPVLLEKTPELLESYRAFLPLLAPYCTRGDADGPGGRETAVITREELLDKLSALYAALDDFDISSAGTLAEELGGRRLDVQGAELLAQLAEQVEAVEYDGAMALVTRWQALVSADHSQ